MKERRCWGDSRRGAISGGTARRVVWFDGGDVRLGRSGKRRWDERLRRRGDVRFFIIGGWWGCRRKEDIGGGLRCRKAQRGRQGIGESGRVWIGRNGG
jgi:hypothetical protein